MSWELAIGLLVFYFSNDNYHTQRLKAICLLAMQKYRLVIKDYSRQFYGRSMLRSPNVFLCAPRIMRSDFDKLNYDNIIDIIKTNYLRDAGRQECKRLQAARKRHAFFRMTVIPCFELQLSKGVDHLIRSLPSLFLRSYRNKPDDSISEKPTA